jgi:hypothetical protein
VFSKALTHSEDACCFRLDLEQHVVVLTLEGGQPLQRQPEQWHRQQQRHQQQLCVMCPLESHPLMGMDVARLLLFVA